MKLISASATFVACIVSACTPSPQEIQYGEDACQHCLMTIVDERHATELVTSKGKVYKFDAIECMVQKMEETKEQEYTLVLVTDYDHPRTLIDAKTAAYLVSPAIPSPMGAFLSAFGTSDRAIAVQKEKDGQVYDWSGLQRVVSKAHK